MEKPPIDQRSSIYPTRSTFEKACKVIGEHLEIDMLGILANIPRIHGSEKNKIFGGEEHVKKKKN